MPHTALTAPRSKSCKKGGEEGTNSSESGSKPQFYAKGGFLIPRLRVLAVRFLFACRCDDGLGRPIKPETYRAWDGNGYS